MEVMCCLAQELRGECSEEQTALNQPQKEANEAK